VVDTERFVWFERHVHPFPGDPLDGSFEVIGPDETNDAFAGISRAHGVVASREHYSGAVFDLAPKLVVLARTGIGIETIDLEAATSRGIAVCNTPDGRNTPLP